MNNLHPADNHESPARRLEVLYVVSLIAVALLSAVGQTFIIRELTRQSETLSAIGQAARQHSIDGSLSLAALAVQASRDPETRRERVDALRKATRRQESNSIGYRQIGTPGKPPIPAETQEEGGFHKAELHRQAAIGLAKKLLDRAGRDGVLPDGADDTGALVEAIVAEEVTCGRVVAEEAVEAEQKALARIASLRSLEFKLSGFVMLVLLFEGIFVISPAVRKIQVFMADMRQSNEEMKSYAEKLERSNKELQDFASVASHDLQEPLRKVQAFSDRLRSKYGGSLDDQGRDYLDRVQNAAKRMQTLINDLLTYARVTTKAQPFVSIDLAVAAREVIADLESRIEQVDGRVEVGELPTVDVDPVQVRQLMQNLIGNALKYHRAEEPPVVKVYSRLLDDDRNATTSAPFARNCQILVEDNGIGFEEVYTDRIFTIFQRLHGRNEYEGTGIGLAVCRKIAERHGGTITARSTPGKGSTFTVTLPVRQAKEAILDEPVR